MQKITPFLWFDKEAGKAAEFYTSAFKAPKFKSLTTIDNTPSGTVEIVPIELAGQDFTLMSAGPLFKFTPAVSFLVACDTKEEVETLWGKLSPGGKALMELGAYPFSEKYGWTQDRYGLSWQVMFMGDRKWKQKITPTLMFVGDNCGKAEEAIHTYTSVFHESQIRDIFRYGKEAAPDREGTVAHAAFTLDGQGFAVMDSAREHNFTFNEALSFVVNCETQEEIDYYWGKLSADLKAEQCGWLKDKYGVSWQVVPTILSQLLGDKDRTKAARVTQAIMKMKKFDIEGLKQAYAGR